MTTGTYLIFISVRTSPENQCKIKIGSLGEIIFKNGIYCYVGSAMGKRSTSIKNRLSRHIRSSYNNLIKDNNQVPKKHWHIDYLLSSKNSKIVKIWILSSQVKEECEIADIISYHSDGFVKNFGSSDCGCQSHLFYFNQENQLI